MSHSKDLVSKLNVLFCSRHLRPILKYCRTATHWFHKWGDLVGPVVREEVGSSFWVSAFPGIAIFLICLALILHLQPGAAPGSGLMRSFMDSTRAIVKDRVHRVRNRFRSGFTNR
jgi:hypothetical protein